MSSNVNGVVPLCLSYNDTKFSHFCLTACVTTDHSDRFRAIGIVRGFLNERAQGWYARCGIPYRKGFLLYGPPGTGKSSFSLSVAGRFGLDIYVLNLSSINNSRLSSLFAQLPPHCVILLEDINASTAQTEGSGTMKNSTRVDIA
ncbi:predicted protein [Histoplasma capsulatum G186AR]|uniref:ATPase AAA-type core domain-containing protein n=1 Tax=Ajellomyces capsulatus (strain G186AR / H82 / ATCC MYA-2454 / RMSCC 2432) TaxID=447093 RepID=C0NVT6_AJECG|nr:uncharacterized protein HCBG_07266 [Histoplasma capsulatum G186AR]EEH04625.1 predicted protein [Histoplasma capsulatum G186AR]